MSDRATLYGSVAQIAALDPGTRATLYGSVAQIAVLDPGTRATLYGSVAQVAALQPTAVATVGNISGPPGVAATFDGSGSQFHHYYKWTWTSLPGGSALSNFPKPLPDNAVGSLMADNEGLYHFEGDANDSSGNSRNLTLHNTPTYVAGKVGSNAINFDGANQYGEVVIPISTTGTIATWLNFSTTPTNGDVIAAFGTLASGTNGSWRAISYHSGGLSFYGRGNTSTDIYNWASVTTGQWYHVVITWDASNLVSCYLDGALITAQTKSLVAPDTTFAVAARLNAGVYYAPVKLDETAVWSRVLSATEVTEVYEQGSKVGLDISTATATFTPDVVGTYTVQLEVASGVTTTADADIAVPAGGGTTLAPSALAPASLAPTSLSPTTLATS